MAQFVRYLVGVAWMLSGALMAFNPPPHEAPRAGQFPAVGAVIMLAGISYFVVAQRNAPASAWPHKHGRVARRLSTSIGMLAFASGAFALWSGASSGQLSVVGLGCALVGVAVLTALNALVGPGLTRALPRKLSPPLGR